MSMLYAFLEQAGGNVIAVGGIDAESLADKIAANYDTLRFTDLSRYEAQTVGAVNAQLKEAQVKISMLESEIEKLHVGGDTSA